MNKIIKFSVSVGLIIVTVAVLYCSMGGMFSAHAAEQEEQLYEPKVQIEVSLEDDFDDSCILVALDKYTSGVNKVFDDDFFGDFPKKSVTDLTHITGDVSSKKYLNTEEFRQIFKIELPVASKQNVLDAIEIASQVDGVLWASPNLRMDLDLCSVNDIGYMNDNSTDWWEIYGTNGIQASAAWTYLDSIKPVEQRATVEVGVIDTGIAVHSSLNNVDRSKGWDYINDEYDTTDDEAGHGTQVAGLIGTSSEGMGVCPNASLIPFQSAIKEYNIQTGQYEYYISLEHVVEMINYASDLNIPILNLSASGTGELPQFEATLNNYSGLLVVAAGNGKRETGIGQNLDSGNYKVYPVAYTNENMIVVSSIDVNGNIPESANYGEYSVDIFAPGVRLVSTSPTYIHDTGFAYVSGTSFAAPLVSGVAAMLLSYDPTLTAVELKAAILRNVDEANNLDGKCVTGGRLNAYKALYAVVNDADMSQYDVTYNPNITRTDRPVTGSTQTVTFEYGTYESLSNGRQFSMTGYEVVGWAKETSTFILGEGTRSDADYAINESVVDITYNDNITLYAVWRPKSWKVWVENDGSIDSLTTYEMHYDGEPLEINAAITGKEFIEWRKYYNNSSGYTVLGTDSSMDIYPNDHLPSGSYASVEGFYIIAVFGDDTCIAEGTLITLADGTQKAVEELTGDEMLLVWNLETGQYDTAPIVFIDSDPEGTYEIIELSFSDGTTVEVISEHGFWDVGLNRYVYLDENAEDYIGHTFKKYGAGGMSEVQLTGVEISEEVTAAYSPVTYGHLCYYVNGMLSMPGGIDGLFNIFAVDPETMKVDEAAYLSDIAEYGLYTYEEFVEEYPISEEVFEAFGGKYLKVAIGKGLITPDEIEGLIVRYTPYF